MECADTSFSGTPTVAFRKFRTGNCQALCCYQLIRGPHEAALPFLPFRGKFFAALHQGSDVVNGFCDRG